MTYELPPLGVHARLENADPTDPEMRRWIRSIRRGAFAQKPTHAECHLDSLVVNIDMPYSVLLDLLALSQRAAEAFAEDLHRMEAMEPATRLELRQAGGSDEEITAFLADESYATVVRSLMALETAANINTIRLAARPLEQDIPPAPCEH